MKTVIGRPALLVSLITRTIATPPANAVFTYGHTVYAPHALSHDLMVHEQTHQRQQGSTPWLWWARYLVDPRFRLRQEAEAYRAQLACFVDRNQRTRALMRLSAVLAGPMYGHVCEPDTARLLIGGQYG